MTKEFYFGLGDPKAKKKSTKEVDIGLLHQHQCKLCPLDKIQGNKHPHMKPSGNPNAVVYVIGEGPGEKEDNRGVPFIGPAGQLLRRNIPDSWIDHVRFNNVVRSRPQKNREPTWTEMECCRPSINQDILATSPRAIFGFGNVPLWWSGIAKEPIGIKLWNGRHVPILVGGKPFWFFPMLHPSFLLHRSSENSSSDEDTIDYTLTFEINMRNALELVENLPDPIVHTGKDAERDIEIIDGSSNEHLDQVIAFLKSLYDEKVVGLDYETKGIRPYAKDAKILTVALSSKDRALAFPFDHPESKFSHRQTEKLKKAFEDFLYEAPCRKAVHALAFEMEWSAFHFGENCLRAQPWEDTMSQSYILDERPGTHSLNFVVLQYFGFHLKQLSDLDKSRLDDESLNNVLNYNAMDARYHRLVYFEQAKELKRTGMEEVYQSQLRRIPTLVLTQLKGIPVDQPTVKSFYEQYTKELKNIEADIADEPDVERFYRKFNYEFRPSAPKDILAFFREIIKIQLDDTQESTLKEIDHPISELVLKWREINKLLSTYVKPLREGDEESELHPDGLLHPLLKTTVTRTWRTSSANPNSQNFSKHEHREVRSQVKAPEGCKIVAFDFAGIQARNVAMESKDESLVDAFWHNYDIHSDWAKETANIYHDWDHEGQLYLDLLDRFESNPDDAEAKAGLKQYRQLSKNKFVFPSFFGAQPPSISINLGVPVEKVERLQSKFWKKFPHIYKWHERVKADYKNMGYVTGLSGFRRHAPISINQIINSGIQADEAFIVCEAMSRLSEMEEDRFQPNLEVHDDLSYIWPTKGIDKNAEVVAKEMTRIAVPWMGIVPIVVELSIGNDWADMKEVAKFSSEEIWGHVRN